MKAILEFDMNKEEDRLRHFRCIKSTDMACALFGISQLLFKDEEPTKDELADIFDYHKINLDELLT